MLRGVVAAAAAAAASARTYNTASQPLRQPGITNVAIISHTHDDVGWLKTVDQYFYGAQQSIQEADVQCIITAATQGLMANPDRRFSYVETAFFSRWWSEQTATVQEQVKALVATGQLEFINGGWCMHDEANPDFVSMIDQTTLGHRFLKDTFGVAPKTTWQIDPFGHSGFNAYAMSSPSAGFNGVFFARADHQDLAWRKANKSTEFFWAPSPSKGTQQATLGGILADYYYPPAGLNFGGDDSVQPIMDDPTLEDFNVPAIVQLFLDTVAGWANFTAPSKDGGMDLMMMMGTDFSYCNANQWYTNIDKLIHYVNLNTSYHGVHAYYGTPSMYATDKIANTKLPLRTTDMLPYGDDAHALWSGYFTSRTALKAYIRETMSVQTAHRQAQAFGAPPTDLGPQNPLYLLERALAVNQHHDAVSGTAKQAVTYDYALRLAKGRAVGQAAMNAALNALSGAGLAFAACDLANGTICDATQTGIAAGKPVAVALWNSQGQAKAAHNVMVPVGVPTGVASWSVTGTNGSALTAQLLPLGEADSLLRDEYYNATTGAAKWLAFQTDIPAAGYAIVVLTPVASAEAAPSTVVSSARTLRTGALALRGKKAAAASQVSNGLITLTLDPTSGRISQFTNSVNGLSAPLVADFFWYNSSNWGGNDDGTGDFAQRSGAYIFRPNSSTTFPVSTDALRVELISAGPVVWEVRQVWPAPGADGVPFWASLTSRLWAGSSRVELVWQVGPIPFADGMGREVILRYSSGLASEGVFYTDSNGRDSMRRLRDKRADDPNYKVWEPVASNYYPVTSFAWLSEPSTGRTLSVVTDRANGGSSLADGELEFMVHRRLHEDDDRGVGEPLNETGVWAKGLVARGRHVLTLDPADTAGANRRAALNDALFPAIKSFAPLPAGTVPATWLAARRPTFTGLAAPLPANVQLLTLHMQSPTQVLLRLAHAFETGEDAQLSQPATVSLTNLFKGWQLTGVVETTLTANQPLAAAPRSTYTTTTGQTYTLPVVPAEPAAPYYNVVLGPMDIRTFVLDIAPTQEAAAALQE